MAVLDAAVAALRLHRLGMTTADLSTCSCRCGWLGKGRDEFDRHVAAQVLAAGFRTANPDDLRDLEASTDA